MKYGTKSIFCLVVCIPDQTVHGDTKRYNTILFYSGHLQRERERPDMERNYMNSDKTQRKESELTT